MGKVFIVYYCWDRAKDDDENGSGIMARSANPMISRSGNGKRTSKKASFSASSCFQTEKLFITSFLIGDLEENRNENQILFRYRHRLS